jgi:hypothetical protein
VRFVIFFRPFWASGYNANAPENEIEVSFALLLLLLQELNKADTAIRRKQVFFIQRIFWLSKKEPPGKAAPV